MTQLKGRSMVKKKSFVPTHLQPWIDARRKFRLSHAHVQMAYELGLNPKKLGKLDNHHQEPWKLPLPDFIVKLYQKRCGKDRPDTVRSIEEIAAAKRAKRLAKKANKAMLRRTPDSGPALSATADMRPTTAATDGGAQEQENAK
jgi:hypothetical protein